MIAAFLDLSMSLIAIAGAIGAAAIGDEDQIILDEVDARLHAIFDVDDLLRNLMIFVARIEDDVLDVDAEIELDMVEAAIPFEN